MYENEDILRKIRAFKRKYYINLLIKGSLFSLALLLVCYLIFSSLEYTFHFNSVLRAILFFSFLFIVFIILYVWLVPPLIAIFYRKRQISDKLSAKEIGAHFPEIDDKLLNILQLRELTGEKKSLIEASIIQKTKEIEPIKFSQAVNLKKNNKYIKYVLAPLLVISILLILSPEVFTESNSRIIHYQQSFTPDAPFQFHLKNEKMYAFKNEDFIINLELKGTAIPANTYLVLNGRKIKMEKSSINSFEYVIEKVQRDFSFSFDAAGFVSRDYFIEIFNRPSLKNLKVFLTYPDYLKKKDEVLDNTGNLRIPQGTFVRWHFNTFESDSLEITFLQTNETVKPSKVEATVFEFEKKAFVPDDYLITLRNKHGQNKEKMLYHLEVIPDQYPKVSIDQFHDTLLYNYLIVGGNISDDYGLSGLKLHYSITKPQEEKPASNGVISIPLNGEESKQSYYYQWLFDSLRLKEGDEISYFLQVWDNDGINGPKYAKTGIYKIKFPSKEEINARLEKASQASHSQLDKAVRQTKELQEQLNRLEDKLKSKKNLSWQDEQNLRELIEKKEEISKEIKKLQQQNREANLQRERFTKQDKALEQKTEQLQNLMEELLDEETKRLYNELQKLLEEQKELGQVQDILEELNFKEDNLGKELDRALELFKQIKFENELQETIRNLDKLAEKQEELSQEKQEKQKENSKLLEEQERLNKEFGEVEKSLEELKQFNQTLKNPRPVQNTADEQEKIHQEQQNSTKALQNKKQKQAKQAQKKAADKLKKLADRLESMQKATASAAMQENLDDLQQIMDNLVKLSFDQEDLMDNFREVRQSDPRFVTLSQQQLRLRDNAKIIEDSLLALASRVFQIASFVTREVGEMNRNMDESIRALKDRNQPEAISKQQFTMTSINNLALLLDDVLSQMQQQMAEAMGMPQAGEGQKQQMPGLSELQKQLSQQIQELKKSGKSGRALSEELAKLAAEQEKIRRALRELEEKLGQETGSKGGGLNDIAEKMEKTETDLVNKRITQETIERQKEIMTRLLEAEKALRERDTDNQREGVRAGQYEQEIPKAFEDYIKTKEKEIEFLKTIPLKLNPYYKNEVNKYFKRIYQDQP